ncbi:hypothetical protein J5278_24230 [Rhizobium sp. B21/90]|nr:hypothetical protein [Rhizobium sp. B21/90]QYA03891.1 hypothetical protein J5278_24230 [Rhizobium sp. B21/90]
MRAALRRLASSMLVHLLLASAAMGSWAFYANRRYPMPQPLSAGLVQGMLSALLMVLQKSAIDVLARRFPGSAALWAPPLITGLGSAAVLILVHRLGGTPRIAQTITLPLIVSTSYATIYTFCIVRARGETQ